MFRIIMKTCTVLFVMANIESYLLSEYWYLLINYYTFTQRQTMSCKKSEEDLYE